MKYALNILCLIFLFHFPIHSQITQEEYKKEKEISMNHKTEYQNKVVELKSEIDSLTDLINDKEQEIILCFRELYVMKYGNEIGQRVAYNQIWKGMTESMMKDSWGEPDKIEKNVKKWGVFTQWYYGEVTFFFKDGKLIDWEEGPESEGNQGEFYLNKRK
jgi:hypothetical protein